MSERAFITDREAYIEAIRKEEIPVKYFKALLFQKALKSGLFKSKAYGLSRKVMNELHRTGVVSFEEQDRFSVSFNILYEKYSKEMRPLHTYTRLTKFLKRAGELELLEKYYPDDSMVLFDEGVLHHHFGVTSYARKKFEEEELSKDPVLNPAGIISCEQSIEAIYRQSMKRKESGVETYSQGHLYGEELMKRIETTMENHKRKVESFRKRGVPILEINTGEIPDKIISDIISFTEELK